VPMLLLWMLVGLIGIVACLVMSLCCAFFLVSRDQRKQMLLPVALVTGLLLVRYGGAAFLARGELFWRAGVRTVFAVAIAVAFGWMVRRTLRCVDELPAKETWVGPALHLCGLLTLLAVLVFGGVSLLFGTWKDYEDRWEGQRVVVEYSGIFHATGYRYVNGLVHGEQLFEWED